MEFLEGERGRVDEAHFDRVWVDVCVTLLSVTLFGPLVYCGRAGLVAVSTAVRFEEKVEECIPEPGGRGKLSSHCCLPLKERNAAVPSCVVLNLDWIECAVVFSTATTQHSSPRGSGYIPCLVPLDIVPALPDTLPRLSPVA